MLDQQLHQLAITLSVLLAITAENPKEYYHIFPNDSSSHSACGNFSSEGCITLEQFASTNISSDHEYSHDNITLIFAQGTHFLSGGIKFIKTAHIVLKGHIENNSGDVPKISCQEIHCFLLINITSIQIESLAFSECVSETFDGGALFIYNADKVTITKCTFIDNVVKKRGGAIRMEMAKSVHIFQSSFINNSAMCDPSSILSLFGATFCALDCIASGGAISSINSSMFIIEQSYFNRNKATCDGGALGFADSNLTVIDSQFTNNIAQVSTSKGGTMDVRLGSVQITNSSYVNNRASYWGGAIFSTAKMDISQSFFMFNEARLGGGTFSAGSSMSIDDTVYFSNVASDGGALSMFNNDHTVISISSSIFVNNYALLSGGAIFFRRGVLNSFNATFQGNTGAFGGAISSSLGTLNISHTKFTSNKASNSGGCINSNGIVKSYNSTYVNNIGGTYGGAIYIFNGSVFTADDLFVNNSGVQHGGAIHSFFSHVYSHGSNYSNNTIPISGGAIHIHEGSLKTSRSCYQENSANDGGAIFVIRSNINFESDYFQSNLAKLSGAAIFQASGSMQLLNAAFTKNRVTSKTSDMYIIHLTGVQCTIKDLIFTHNSGSLHMLSSMVNFTGKVVLTNNTAKTGGALTIIQSTLLFDPLSHVTISRNTASFGGGVLLSGSDLRIHTSSIVISENRAMISGGGIYGYQSQINIQIHDTSQMMWLASNTAVHEGGAIHAISTSLKLYSGFVQFSTNSASKGGAVSLLEGSKVYLLKTIGESLDEFIIKLIFSNNSALFGGALYVSDTTNTRVLCEHSKGPKVQSLTSAECFIQSLGLYYPSNFSFSGYNYINTFFTNNIALAGNDIHGGLLDRCQINSFSEVHRNFFKYFNGFDYLKTIAQFDIDINYVQLTHPFNPDRLTKVISRHLVTGLITSDAIQLCFCVKHTLNCTYQYPTMFRKRGEMFSVMAVTVDQVENPKNGTVVATVISDGTRLKVGQAQQITNGQCSELIYNVYSTERNASIELYSDGPCNNLGISSKVINIMFLPCECPNGFQPAPLDNECRCECDPTLDSLISNCELDRDNVTVVRQREDVWINYVSSENVTGFQYIQCPQDYCVKEPVNLSISFPWNVDTQCAYNRSGIMCGECAEGLSLVLGSSKCALCSNTYLALLIAFALAGIALIAFILILNLTVATGTIHGLILYANIIAANSPTFLPPQVNAAHFCIAWLNLDLGIETCFYDGMDSYAKILLQLVFPIYIILLTALIILLSRYWGRFAGLIGRKNPVATLCTLILLSYSKLLRTIIASLQFMYLDYPDGSQATLWLYDPNVPYLRPGHIPRFIIASIIIILGTVYTILLFFGQWFRKLSNKKFMKWARNTKYNAFLDAYHAPYVYKHRHWIGVLLLARIIHHFSSAVLDESTHLLIVACLAIGLVILKILLNKIYKNWLLNMLETSLFINLLLFSIGIYYVQATNKDQAPLTNTSVAIAFLTFCIVILYHMHTYVLLNFQVYQTLTQVIRQSPTVLKQKLKDLTRDNTTDTMELNTPFIERAVARRFHQTREPALDIIAPICTEDYVVPTAAGPVVTSQPVTYTVVDIGSEESHGSSRNECKSEV